VSTRVSRRIRYAELVVTNADQEDKRPASRRVADDLLALIESGELGPGAQLPTYRQLAADYDVAVNTAMAAVRLLRDSGVVKIRTNARAQVRDRSEEVDVASELNAARTQISELRSKMQHFDEELLKLEARLNTLADWLGDNAR
jgi:DNA-binding transcriptional regulator YhcF (GntR family)